MQWARYKQTGFTIVELLIVIVIIAILAAITIVAYNGIQQRAEESSAQSAVASAARTLAISKTQSPTESYPASLPEGVPTAGFTYEYRAATNDYCLTKAVGRVTYFVTSEVQTPQKGTCVGLQAWWPLNGTVDDSIGANEGTNNGGVSTANKNGGNDKAWNLLGNSTTRYVATPYVFSPAAFTASVWARPDGGGPNSFASILSNTRDCCAAYTGFQLQYNRTTFDLVGMLWANGTSSPAATVSKSAIMTVGTWRHLVLTYNGTVFSLYVDGTLQQSATYTLVGSPGNASFPMKIGGGGWTTSGYSYGGDLDDARIYNRALSAEEVQYQYEAGPL